MGADGVRPREPVRAALSAGLRSTAAGSGHLALLTGEPGIGKTTTARELADQARRAGVTVRWSACWHGGATVAHAPWLNLLSGLGEPGHRALEHLIGSTQDDEEAAAASSHRAVAYRAVVGALEDAARQRPLLLVIDDLHWADEGTVALLAAVAGQLPGFPAMVLGTCRSTELQPGSTLASLTGSIDRLDLGGLDVDAVATLLADVVGAARSAELAADVVTRTGGNPFLVTQLARLAAADPGALHRGTLPLGARDLLEGRLSQLSPDDRAVVVAAAVVGSPFRAPDVASVSGRTEAEVLAALDRAARLRIVERTTGVGASAFVHDLFRQAAVDGAPATEVASLHRAAADLLIGSDAEPASIARHLLEAGSGASTEAAAWCVRAGERALGAMAWEEAASHFERALGATRRDHDREVEVAALLGLGRARILQGDGDGAARAFEQVAAVARSVSNPAWLADAALGFSADLSGFEVRLFDTRQLDLLEEAVGALVGGEHDGVRAVLLARLSVALSMTASSDRRLALAEEAVHLARAADSPLALARALAAHCDAIAAPTHVDQRVSEASEIVAIAEHHGDGPLELLGLRLRYVAHLERGDVASAERDHQAFARRAAAIGNPLYSWLPELWSAQMAVVAGDLDAALGAIERSAAIGRAGGSTNAAMLGLVIRLMAAWQQANFDEALAMIEGLNEEAPDLVVYLSSVGATARSHALAGRGAEAWSLLDRAHAAGIDTLPFDAEWLANLAMLVDAAVLMDHPVLGDAVAALEPYAHLVAFEGIGAGLYGSVARYLALGCAALGRTDDAVAFARQALETNRRFGGTVAADSLRTLATVLERAPDADARADAATLHAEADTLYRAVGAAHQVRAAGTTAVVPPTGAAPLAREGRFERDGDVWRVTYAGHSTIVRHSKGMADLAVVLAASGREVHVSELGGVDRALVSGSTTEALDRRAVAAYKSRLAELAEELDDAELAHDSGRAELARVEYDALLDQLSGAMGIGGRSRPLGPEPVERLRKAVSARIRDAIKRIEAAHPALGRHLGVSIQTGIYCSYRPELPVIWRCEARSGVR